MLKFKQFVLYLLLAEIFCFMVTACDQSLEPHSSGPSIPPVYVTVAGHIEDVAVYTQCHAYSDYREKLLTFAQALEPYDVAFNLQIDYEFFIGALECESPTMKSKTDGVNVIHYLATRYDFEIDAHKEGGVEEGRDNYADVRFLAQSVTDSISENVGGLVWDNPQQFRRLALGEPGWMYPEFIWHPKAITLAVSKDHHNGDFSRDDIASGIWKPKGANENFWVHDPKEHLIYIGPGEHSNWGKNNQYLSTLEFIQILSEKMEEGLIARDKMYTVTVTVPQSVIFDTDRHTELFDVLEKIAPLVESGKAVYVTYSEAVRIWKTEYHENPTIYFRKGGEPPNAR